MANDKNIYSSLQVILDSDDLQLKPQSQEKDFGAVGQVFSNSVGVAGAYSQEKIKVLFDANDKLGKQVGSRLIQVNFGIFNVLYKKLEQKSNEKIAKELAIEGATGYVVAKSIETGFVIKQVAKETGKKVGIRAGISIAARIFTGIGTGAIAGSEVPIVGTIIGAVAGGIIASKIEDKVFEDEKKEQEKIKEINEEIKKIYSKINRVVGYLIRNHYTELRELNETEVEELFKSASDPNESYFKTILLMLSFHNYLDRDTEFYKSLQSQDTQKDSKEIESNNTESKKEILIKPIANAIPLRLAIQECYDSSKGALLKNTTIYIYNHRFQRVVAKGTTDSKGSLQIDTISVGQEIGIDKISFIVDRDNLSESNFELSKTQYATITNIQTKHKQAKEYTANKIYLGFNDVQSKLKADYEVIRLHAQKGSNAITFTPQINTTDMRYKQYTQFAYMTFNVMDFGIDEYIANISIQNRQSSGLNRLGTGLKESYPIKEEWHNKIVAFFGYCDSQIHTPYVKMSFMQPIVIIDIGDSGALHPRYEQGGMKRRDIILDVIAKLIKRIEQIRAYPIILGQNNESLEQRVKIANAIKHNIQDDRILLLSLHIDSEESGLASGMRCFYNAREYAREEEGFINKLERVKQDKNNANFAHKSNMYLTRFAAMPSVLITLGFISNESDRAKLNDINYRNALVGSLHLAILHHTQDMAKNPVQRVS